MTRGILIDVTNKTITEVVVTENERGSQLSSIYEHVDCELVNVLNIGDHDIYVDDEGLFKKPPSELKFFVWEDFDQPIPGNGLIMGFDSNTGSSMNCELTIEYVKSKVKFLSYEDVIGIYN